ALGEPMRFDHRRILATAIARLRGKLKYRPVIFELMASEFTLTELQRTVEAISGRRLHKQNFRRLVETTALVEPTGETSAAAGRRRYSASAARSCRNVPPPACGWVRAADATAIRASRQFTMGSALCRALYAPARTRASIEQATEAIRGISCCRIGRMDAFLTLGILFGALLLAVPVIAIAALVKVPALATQPPDFALRLPSTERR